MTTHSIQLLGAKHMDKHLFYAIIYVYGQFKYTTESMSKFIIWSVVFFFEKKRQLVKE